MNDIVAEFASSLDEQGNLKQYHIVAGSIFSDEYNETLDSAVLVLDHVKVEDRLIDLEPYEYVHVFDINNKSNFDRLYLVDNFSEQEKNINENLFSYTVNLMSETKLLEKIQCPNVAITHRVQQGATLYLSIYEHMRRYIELYVPEAKMINSDGTWSYKKIITIPEEGTDFYNKFNVQCADMAFNMPTLRQLLTTLMQQVGCLPTVRGGVLGYIDLRKEAIDFSRGETPDYTADYTVSRIQRSLSSDSYANTLINISDNVLDSGNKIVSERLGFRDKNSAVLKQTENLYLETKFPIYKVNSFKMNAWGGVKGVGNILETDITSRYSSEQFGTLNPQGIEIENSTLKYKIRWNRNSYAIDYNYLYIGFEIKVCFYKDNVLVNEYENLNAYHAWNYGSGSQLDFVYEIPNVIPNDYNQIGIKIKIFVVRQVDENNQVVSGGTTISEDCQTLIYYNNSTNLIAPPINGLPFLIQFDITPLLKEESVRQNLKVNFLDMNWENIRTIEELAEYIYGTIGYSIGSKRISGFSSTYTQTFAMVFGPTGKTKTYIENIFYFVANRFSHAKLVEEIMSHTTMLIVPKMLEQAEIEALSVDDGYISFVPFTFDIEYQPLNSFNLSFSKQNRDIPYPIEQLDMNASGLTDFDRLALKEQETVDRIGNEILSISQRTTTLEDIRGTDENGQFVPVYFREDKNRDKDYDDPNETRKYVIFKRQISVSDYYYDISYTGMENAILKNFFTAIRTKYRAYELVDYNQSVLRKERDVIYVRLGTDVIHGGGSDNIHFPWYRNDDQFIDGFKFYEHNVDKQINNLLYSDNVKYICEIGWSNHPLVREQNYAAVVKNDVSIITTDKILAFVYENDDNAGAGTYISSSKYSTFYHDEEKGEDKKIGGVPQSWQIWRDVSSNPLLINYNKDHYVIFTGTLNITPELLTVTNFTDEMTTSIANRQAVLPYVNAWFGGYDAWSSTANDSKKFSIGKYVEASDGTLITLAGYSNYTRLFYKDYSERINHTVQFVYYTDEPELIAWTELFIANSSLVQNSKESYTKQTMCIISKNIDNASLDNNPDWHQLPNDATGATNFQSLEDRGTPYTDTINVVNYGSGHCINVTWGENKVITVALVKTENNVNYFKDIVSFKKPEGAGETTSFYITFNDTKSNYVLDRNEDGLLRKVAKVEYNGSADRGTKPLN